MTPSAARIMRALPKADPDSHLHLTRAECLDDPGQAVGVEVGHEGVGIELLDVPDAGLAVFGGVGEELFGGFGILGEIALGALDRQKR